MFPPEVIEKILYYCDGKTLLSARNVNGNWRKIYNYVSKQTDFWKKCCYSDIPRNEFIMYLSKWMEDYDKEMWHNIYINWIAWQEIDLNIDFKLSLSLPTPRVTCLSASRHYVVLGFENGCVKILDKHFQLLSSFSHLNISVLGVNIICEDEHQEPTELVTFYKNSIIYINDFIYETNMPAKLTDFNIYSIYKNFICGISSNGKLMIVRITTDFARRCKSYDLITHLRIYSPSMVTSCRIWDGRCTLLVNSKVQTFAFGNKPQITHVKPRTRTELTRTYKEEFKCWIYNDVVITIGYTERNTQIFELFLLEENGGHSQKIFFPWPILTVNITCMYLYGNTFLIGSDSGAVYFYEISEWRKFDLRIYRHMEQVSRAPVLAIDSVEMHKKRIFYIATTFEVHKLKGKIKSTSEVLC